MTDETVGSYTDEQRTESPVIWDRGKPLRCSGATLQVGAPDSGNRKEIDFLEVDSFTISWEVEKTDGE